MSANMSIQEKFEVLMQNFQYISFSNQELEHQNEYLRWPLVDILKQTKKAKVSPSGSAHEDEGEISSKIFEIFK